MVSSSVVFYKIATTCLLIFAGFVARRLRLLPESAISVISKHILFIATPAYVVFYMPASISLETLHLYWYYPAVGFLLIAANDLFAYGGARLLAKPGQLPTFRLLVAVPNWVFMALAVCEPIFREEGVRVVLLFNLGIIFYVWSFGMTSFRARGTFMETAREMFINIQTVSAAIGVVLAFACPWLRGMESLGPEQLAALPWHRGVFVPLWETVYLLGGTALPLSIFQLGLLLGTPPTSADEGGDPVTLLAVSALRMLASPLLAMGIMLVLCRMGAGFTASEFVTGVVIFAMPAAVVCLVIVEVYGGTARLAAMGILWMSVASLFTTPLVTWMAQRAYQWV